MIGRLWDAFLDRVLLFEGSTRSAGLLRILLALLAWARFADDVLPFRDLHPERLLLTASFFASTTLMLFGVASRVSTLWAGGTLLTMVFWFGHARDVEPWTHHHTTILALAVALLSLTPCGRSYSVDRWLALSRAERAGEPSPEERGPLWGLTLVAFLVSTVYFWSAVDKTTWTFLSGQHLQAVFMEIYVGSDFPSVPGYAQLCAVLAVITVVVEYVLPFGLFVRRWQKVLVPAGLALHGIFYVALPVSTFSLTMWALYLAYLDPEVVHRAIDRMSGRSSQERAPTPRAS